MTRRLLLLALLALTLLVPASAVAVPPSSGHSKASRTDHSRQTGRGAASRTAPGAIRDPVATAGAIAERFWGAVPCGGKITVTANRPLAPGLDPSTDAWVTFDSSLGADQLAAPAATYRNCTITLAHWQWASRTEMERDWGMFCLTVVHEMGHLLGRPHSSAPGNVMAPVFTDDANVPAACHTSWLPGRRPAGAR